MSIKLPADVSIEAEVDLRTGGDGYSLAARLNVSIPGVDRDLAKQLVQVAHQVCPYSKATRGNMDAAVNVA